MQNTYVYKPVTIRSAPCGTSMETIWRHPPPHQSPNNSNIQIQAGRQNKSKWRQRIHTHRRPVKEMEYNLDIRHIPHTGIKTHASRQMMLNHSNELPIIYKELKCQSQHLLWDVCDAPTHRHGCKSRATLPSQRGAVHQSTFRKHTESTSHQSRGRRHHQKRQTLGIKP